MNASAHEPSIFGFGSRAAAMAGAVAADANDPSANYYNPAGLVTESGLRLSLGYYYAEQNLLINEQNSGVNSAHGISFGLAAAGELLGLPLAIGIAAHFPDEGFSRITALRQDAPRWELYDNRASVVYVSANLAVRPFDFLEVGAGLSFLAATRGSFEITGEADLLFPYDSELRHQVDVDLTSVRYPQVGVLIHLAPSASLGVVYRGEAKLDLELSGSIEGTLNAAGFVVPLSYTLSAHTVQAFLPQQVVLGASWRFLRSVTVNADVTWVNWSAYENPTAETRANLRVEPPPQFPIELPGELAPTTLEDPRFADRIVPRVGVEYFLPDFTNSAGIAIARIPVRAGYFFEASPVPPQTGATNFVDADRHTVSVGVGVGVVPIGLTIDGHAAFSLLPERTTNKSRAYDLVGDYAQEGQMVNVGITLGGHFE